MLLTTTNNIEGKQITQYYGIVTGETIIGANVFRDFMAGIRDFFGAVRAVTKRFCARRKTLRCRR